MGPKSVIAKKIAAFFVSLLAVLVWSKSAAAAVYTSPDGIKISSDSPAWNTEAKLKKIYEELQKNAHGEEWKLLAEVRIHDGYPKGRSVAGEYRFRTSVDLFGRQKMLPGSIDLYGGNERTTVESLAKTLAHEYGHHVTHYYSIREDGFSLIDENRWRRSTYAKIRGLSGDPRVNSSDEHRWQLAEIAAEDYVQLFGSPTAKKQYAFPSRYEQLLKHKAIGPLQWDASMYNVAPQENLELPLAAKVPGLYEWFAKHFGVSSRPDFPGEPELNIKEVIKEGSLGYQIRFEWTPGKNASANTFYTLVAYGDGDVLPEPVVTRKGNEQLEGRYGVMVVRTATSILSYQDPNAKGIRHFRVFAQSPDGFVVSSPILTVDLDHPTQVVITEQAVNQTRAINSFDVQVREGAGNLSGFSEWAGVFVQGVALFVEVISRFLEHLIKFVS